MNELIFFIHILFALIFLLTSLKLGKKALVCFFAISAIFANLFVTKQISLFHLSVTAADAYAVSCLLSLNLMQEFFGKKTARKAIWITLFFSIYFIIMSQIHLAYRPHPFDTTSSSFHAILAFSPRIFFTSLAVGFLVQRLDVSLYGFLKKRWRDHFYLSRITLSFFITQLLDTVLFTYVALYGIVKNPLEIIMMSYLVKLFIFFSMAPFLHFSQRFVLERKSL